MVKSGVVRTSMGGLLFALFGDDATDGGDLI
jgi:hypothetical protein